MSLDELSGKISDPTIKGDNYSNIYGGIPLNYSTIKLQ